MLRFLTSLIVSFSITTYCDAAEIVCITRPDGTELYSYVSFPPSESYPIALVIQGSEKESVLPLHIQFADAVTEFGAGLVTLEKHGMYPSGYIDTFQYDLTNCPEYRITDHKTYIQSLREGLLPGWNGQLIVVGASEGGAIASSVAAKTAETVAAVFYSTGGGLSVREQLRLATRKYYEKRKTPNFIIKATVAVAENQLDEMMGDPTPYKHFLGYTYKWWEGYAAQIGEIRENIFHLNCPIFYVHGVDDEMIPVESADILVREFNSTGRDNLTYLRLDGYPHDLRQPPVDIVVETTNWLRSIGLTPKPS